MDLQAAVTQARALDTAQKNADLYETHVTAEADLTPPPSVPPLESNHNGGDSASCAALKQIVIFADLPHIRDPNAQHEKQYVANVKRKDIINAFASLKQLLLMNLPQLQCTRRY